MTDLLVKWEAKIIDSVPAQYSGLPGVRDSCSVKLRGSFVADSDDEARFCVATLEAEMRNDHRCAGFMAYYDKAHPNAKRNKHLKTNRVYLDRERQPEYHAEIMAMYGLDKIGVPA